MMIGALTLGNTYGFLINQSSFTGGETPLILTMNIINRVN